METFRDQKIRQDAIQETMDKVHPRVLARSQSENDDLLAETPVKITLKDGRVLEHATHRMQVLGSQNNPWGFDNIKSKFQANARMALADAEAEEAVAVWSDITSGGRRGGDYQADPGQGLRRKRELRARRV